MSTFYGIGPDEVPGFVGLGERHVPFDQTPVATRDQIRSLLEHFRWLHSEDPAAFEAVVSFVGARIGMTDEHEATS